MLLETERLFIRCFSEEDKEDLYDYLSKEEVVKYEPYTRYSRQAAAEEAARRADDPNFYAVALKSGKVIGNLYLSKGDYDTWELGYVFNSDFRREGTLIRNIYFFCDEAGEPLWQDTYEYGILKEEWRAGADKECV